MTSQANNENNRQYDEVQKQLGLTVTLELESHHPTTCSRNNMMNIQIPPAFPTNCLSLHNMSSMNRSTQQHHDQQQQQQQQQYPPIITLARRVFSKHQGSKHKNKQRKTNATRDDFITTWKPTPVQLQCWPILTCSNTTNKSSGSTAGNLIALAPTGSGKTLGYSIPMVQTCLERVPTSFMDTTTTTATYYRKIHGLVLVPTRELSIQVSKVLKLTAKCANELLKRRNVISSMAIYGGVKKEEQIKELLGEIETGQEEKTGGEEEKNKDGTLSFLLLSATPMRLMDLLGFNVVEHNNGHGDDNDAKEKNCHPSHTHHHHHDVQHPSLLIRSLFSTTQFLVIDEADRMATHVDISQQVGQIVRFVKETSSCLDHQCLFSATLPEKALSVCHGWVSTPRVCVRVHAWTVGSSTVTATATATTTKDATSNKHLPKRGRMDLSTIPSHITQVLHVCSNHKKPRKLLHTIEKIRKQEQQGSTNNNDDGKRKKRRNKGLMIVFFGRIKTLQYVEKLLVKEGIQCLPFHSQMNQPKRERQLHLFKCGKVPILLATDIAARGIHCNNVEYVINYDFPSSLEQYVHRCGRAGRHKVHGDGDGGGDGGDDDDNVQSSSMQTSTVYSFFHRELAPMAKDVIELLCKSNSWVDPNLLALVPDSERSMEQVGQQHKRKRRKRGMVEASTTANDKVHAHHHVDDHDHDHENGHDHDDEDAQDDDDEEDDEFASLGQNRIIFQRASHVQDDSDDDDDDENTNQE